MGRDVPQERSVVRGVRAAGARAARLGTAFRRDGAHAADTVVRHAADPAETAGWGRAPDGMLAA